MLEKNKLNLELYECCHVKVGASIDIKKVKSLLEKRADPNFIMHCDLFPHVTQNKDYTFPLLHIITGKKNSVEAANVLLEFGAHLDSTDTCIGNTALLTALALRDENLAKFLIEKIRASENPIHRELLSKKDLGIECQNTPIVLALKKQMPEIAQMLIHAGADANTKCRNEETALHWACMLRKDDVIKMLLEHKADVNVVNKYSRTAYDYYTYNISYIDIANPYQEGRGRRVLRANMDEFSDLYFHTSESFRDYVHTELQNRIKYRNETPINAELSKSLFAKGTSQITLEKQHKAIIESQFDKILKEENRSFMVAIYPRDLQEFLKSINEIIDQVIADQENERFKNAPLSLASRKADREKISALLAAKAEINAQSNDGFTALHWAAMRRNEEMIALYIANGANPTIKNKYGWTALDYYKHQIESSDLNNDTKHSVMPGFEEVFWNEMMRELGVPKRNKKIVNLELFSPKVPKKEDLATEDKYTISVKTDNANTASDLQIKQVLTTNQNKWEIIDCTDKRIALQLGQLAIIFEEAKDFGGDWNFNVSNGKENSGMYISRESIQTVVNCLHKKNIDDLINILKTWGTSARQLANRLEKGIKNCDLSQTAKLITTGKYDSDPLFSRESTKQNHPTSDNNNEDYYSSPFIAPLD